MSVGGPELQSRPRDAALYAAAFLSYVAVAIWQKFLLNWIVGPLWLVAFAEIAARWQRRTRARRR